ncbi:MAG: insulinase family protein [Defluviitaleaceae bacterium]|nr:insulinase family protein [Defluviitaleaceae bacterium]
MRYNDLLGESMYDTQLPNGLKCFVFPKKDYVEKQAVFVVKYGSTDRLAWRAAPPDGVAHFMEHKMFEDAEMNMYDSFLKNGADVNAYTNFTVTAYYFTCVDNFQENLKLLAHMVGSPYFTDENVEKEKGIISQEINMYADNPHWRLYMNLQGALYGDGPVSVDIAGSVASIQEINKDILYDYYHGFYAPANMAFICAGDVDAEEAVKICGENFKLNGAVGDRVLNPPDTAPVRGNYAEKQLDVSIPMLALGFKNRDFAAQQTDNIAVSKILADILAGESSSLYEKMYNEGIIDQSFSADYASGSFFGASVFTGASKRPERVKEMILGEVSKLSAEGIGRPRFETVKRKHIGQYIAGFNAIDRIAGLQAELFSLGHDMFGYADSYANVTLDAVNERLRKHYLEENCALSVIRPKNA